MQEIKYINRLHISLFLLTIVALLAILPINSDLFVLCTYISFCILLFNSGTQTFIKYFYFYFGSIWGIISVFILENGNVILRGLPSARTGSFPLYTLSFMTFFLSITYFDLKNAKQNRERKINVKIGKYNEAIRTVILIASVLLFSSVITHPYFSITGYVDRFAYRDMYLQKGIPTIYNYVLAFIPFMLSKRVTKLFSKTVIYLLMLVLYNIFIGEKFTGLFLIFYLVSMSDVQGRILSREKIIQFYNRHSRKNWQYLRNVALVLAILVYLVYTQIVVVFRNESIITFFTTRFVAQGEAWWLTYAKLKYDNISHLSEFLDEISGIVNSFVIRNTFTQNYGIGKIMKYSMDSSLVASMLNRGIRATETTRASLLYYFGPLGMIISHVIIAYVVHRAMLLLEKSIRDRNAFDSVLSTYFFISTIQLYGMSDFQIMFTGKNLLIILYFSIRTILHRNLESKKSANRKLDTLRVLYSKSA